jgi:hypothetical protein
MIMISINQIRNRLRRDLSVVTQDLLYMSIVRSCPTTVVTDALCSAALIVATSIDFVSRPARLRLKLWEHND